MDTSAAVDDVLKRKLGTGKTVEIQATKGTFDHLLCNVRPLQAIDLLAERAVAAEDKYYSSLFIFFENKDGYHFETIEKLLEAGPVDTYVYNSEHRHDTYRELTIIGGAFPAQWTRVDGHRTRAVSDFNTKSHGSIAPKLHARGTDRADVATADEVTSGDVVVDPRANVGSDALFSQERVAHKPPDRDNEVEVSGACNTDSLYRQEAVGPEAGSECQADVHLIVGIK